MENPSSLANPKKLSLKDFPAEKKRKKESWWKKYRRRQKRNAKYHHKEKNIKHIGRQKQKKKSPGFFKRIILDFQENRKERRELRAERNRIRKHQPSFIKRLKHDFREYRQEQHWKNKQSAKRKGQRNFWSAILLFFLGPLLDFRDEVIAERAEKKLRKVKFPQPNLFQRLWEDYKEVRDTAQQRKYLDRMVRKSLSFVVEEDKRVFSLREELEHMRDTWKGLPWNWPREIQNMIAVTIVFVLTFSILFGVFQLSKFLVAAAYSIPGVWRDGMIVFTIPDPSPLWTYSSVLSVYSVGPFVLVIIGFIFQRLQKKVKDQGSFKSLVLMWIYVNAYILVFGTFLAGYFTDRGFGYVMGWLYIPWIVEVPLALFSVVMLWVIGYRLGKKMLVFRHSSFFIDTVLPQLYYKLIYFYIPIIVGIGILFLMGLNNNDFTQNVVYVSILTMLTPTLRFIPEKSQN
ncbi:MAG: hypothetical protein DRI74_09120 [Bacteroidetes bacterium]|nr:MAG: hypothetical protein DRI74_09120 [Bacteroidota bacterium]